MEPSPTPFKIGPVKSTLRVFRRPCAELRVNSVFLSHPGHYDAHRRLWVTAAFFGHNGVAPVLCLSPPREMPFGRNPEIFRWFLQLHKVTLPQTVLFCFCLDRPNWSSHIYSWRSRIFLAWQKSSIRNILFNQTALNIPLMFESHLQNVPLKYWDVQIVFLQWF